MNLSSESISIALSLAPLYTLSKISQKGYIMPPEERELPLFPLNTVLFPGGSLPIQIFEDRYKLMLDHCLEADSRFGLVFIKSGSEVGAPAIPYSIGTVAQIVQVNRVEGGRIFISATGINRFRIQSITQYEPYMKADVQLFTEADDSGEPPAKLDEIRDAINQYARLIVGLRGGWVDRARLPSDPRSLSYFVADMLQISVRDKQALLERPTAKERLEAEWDIIKREAEVLKTRVSSELRGKFSKQ